MAGDRDGALLAHIADTVTELQTEQSAMVVILTRLLEAGEAQTEMLAEILGAARQDPGPSETAQALASLAEAIGAMAEQIASLPAEIGVEVGSALGAGAKAESR